MSITRRSLVGAAAVAGVGYSRFSSAAERTSVASPKYAAIAFDAFPIIDPRPVVALAENLFPGRGEQLSSAWRTRQFEYTWLRSLSDQYVDFWHVTEDALIFAARSLGLDLGDERRDQLMQSYLQLKAWPDALPALRALQGAGLRMAFLSNFTAQMLDAALRNSGLESFFADHLTTDRVRVFKPDSRAYQMGPSAFQCTRDRIVFVASAAWDAAGAKWFGYPTFWLNRASLPSEVLDVTPDAEGKSMRDLVHFVLGSRGAGTESPTTT